MPRWIANLLLIVAVLTGAYCLRADVHTDDLQRAGIEPSVEGIRRFLKEFTPSPEQAKRIEILVAQLGADDFDQRESASMALKGLAPQPRAALQRALKNNDAEIRWRAEEILKNTDDPTQGRLYTVCKVIARQQYLGMAKDLIALLPLIEGEEGKAAARKALAATATREDAPQLRPLLKSASDHERAGGAAALAAALGRDSITELKPLLADASPMVALAAARALANFGDRDSLAAFVRLIESENPAIAFEALSALRSLTGKTFTGSGDDEVKNRAEVAAQWKAWLKAEGETVPLRTPIQLAEIIELFNGVNLDGWQAVYGGALGNAKEAWSVKDGNLACAGQGAGYLRTKQSFLNYELSLEWRWPDNQAGDSGVWLLLSGKDAAQPKGLEVQLLGNKAGDFWLLGGLTCKADGNPAAGYVARKKDPLEKKLGEWNRLDVRVLRGAVTVKVNGVEVNTVTDCPKDPGCIALQMEGSAIQFRRIQLQPLEE